MKLNFAIFKKGKPIYWVIGGLVIFVLFYLMFNKGASSSGGGITTVNAGPSDAQIASATQIAMATIGANASNQQTAAGLAIAGMQLQGRIAEIQAGADVAKYVSSLDAATAGKTLDTQLEIAGLSAEYNFSTAKLAADVTRDQFLSNERILKTQAETQADMFAKQIDALKFNTLVSGVQFAPEVDRDNMLALIAATQSGKPLNYFDAGSGSFSVNGAGNVTPGYNNHWIVG